MDGMGETGYPQRQLAAIFWVEELSHKFPVSRGGPFWQTDRLWLKPRGKLSEFTTLDLDPMCPNVGLHLAPVPPVKPLLDLDHKNEVEVAWRLKKGNARVNVTGYPGSSSLPLCLDLIWLCGMLIHSFVFYCVDSIILVLLSITWLDNATNAYHIVMTHHQCSCIQHIFIWILFYVKTNYVQFQHQFPCDGIREVRKFITFR